MEFLKEREKPSKFSSSVGTAQYSISIKELETNLCFLEDQEIGAAEKQ